MKQLLSTLLLAALLPVAHSPLSAQGTTPPAPKSALDDRLARALRLFPDADANKDGTLSLAEAQKYAESRPELRAALVARTDAGGGKSSSKPASFAPGAQGTRVFVCAHSYMIYTADLLPLTAKAAGIAQLDAGRQMIGGSQVIQHWNLPDEKNQAKQALREGIVDVLMLSPHLLLPDEGIANYTRLGLEKNPRLRVLVQSSWMPLDGRSLAGNRGDFKNEMRDAVTAAAVRQMRDDHNGGWLKNLEAQVRALNASVGKEAVFIVPVSAAVFALRERIAEGRAPGLAKQSQMFRDDHGHPAPPMAQLVTYCHFAAIYQRSPVGLPVPALLKDAPQAEALNRLLQQLAWEAVSGYPMSGVPAGAETKAP